MLSNGFTKTRSDQLKESLKKIYNEKVPGTALNKCKLFCTGMKTDDIGIIVYNQRIAFIKIGEYY